jgi:hypothetical protein
MTQRTTRGEADIDFEERDTSKNARPGRTRDLEERETGEMRRLGRGRTGVKLDGIIEC